jgi:RimJ/RimL family protein N-acetyltransferase
VSLTAAQPATLPGDRVILRPWSPDDEAYVRAAHSDPEIRRWSPFPLSVDDAEQVAQRRLHPGPDEPPAWIIADSASGDAVGDLSFRWIFPWLRVAAVGYVVLAAARDRGVASEAVRLASDHVLGPLGWPRLELHHAVGNLASCRVAQRCGFRLEGTLRQALRYADGTWADQHLHARLTTDVVG